MNNTQRLAKIDALLASVPTFKCKEGCADCCGPVMMSRLELKRIVERTGINPKRLASDWMLKKGCIDCPLLTPDNRCSVYDIRPAICKIFGSSSHPRLVCPHKLGPDNPIGPKETNKLVDEVMALGHGLSNPIEREASQWLKSIGLEHVI